MLVRTVISADCRLPGRYEQLDLKLQSTPHQMARAFYKQILTQVDQFADGIAPALRAAAPISRPAVSDHWHRHLIALARPMASLPLGVAESMLPFRLATSWHGFVLRYVTGLYGSARGLAASADDRRGARLGRVASHRNLVFGWTCVGSGP